MTRPIKVLADARALLADVERRTAPEARDALKTALAEVASTDGDRVLDGFEAEALRDSFNAVLGANQTLGADQVDALRDALSLKVSELKAGRIQDTEVMFTSEGRALDRFRGKILETMDATIAKADGKPVDVNMMVFAFTDEQLADGILERARNHPNVNFRLITDWTQLSLSGNKQPRRIGQVAREEGLDNIQIKYKRDNPYIWDRERKRPRFYHPASKGLNHHKGFVTLIDGRPEKMSFGSFNWSKGAMRSNYENMMILDRHDPDHRRIMKGYESEFEAFWNNDSVALTEREALTEKDRLFRELHEANGESYTARRIDSPEEVDPLYVAEDRHGGFDINSVADEDHGALVSVVGKTTAKRIQKEIRDYGRIDTYPELLARVPDLARKPTWVREQLREHGEFGEGGLSINTAGVSELDRAGMSRRQAERVVARREAHGTFETLSELGLIRGIGPKTVERIAPNLSDDASSGYYSARIPEEAATTGFAAEHRGEVAVRSRESAGASNAEAPSLERMDRNLAAPVTDLLRRTPEGQTFRLAMYGMSTRSPEYREMVAALERGVPVRVVLYGKYGASTIEAMKALRDRGLDLDFRVFKSRVMHEKFGVSGDDLFNGSANWSTSSMLKHSEDRFVFHNEPELAQRFVEEFERLWERGSQ